MISMMVYSVTSQDDGRKFSTKPRDGELVKVMANCDLCDHKCGLTFVIPRKYLSVFAEDLAGKFSSLCTGMAKASSTCDALDGLNRLTSGVRKHQRRKRGDK